jgi:midasin (ATPase involved in ribosome maturation)
MINRTEIKQKFIDALVATGKQTITRAEIKTIATKLGLKSTQFFTKENSNRVGRGEYRVPQSGMNMAPALQAQVISITKQSEKSDHKIQNVQTDLDTTNLIPATYKNYVPFGNFDDVYSIVQSMRFFPVFVSGHSGNGKTMSIEQACAKAKRKFVCVSMTPETDESDLLGNYVLIDGNMEWRDGPVTTAARQGAVLCIDEIDYGAQNLSSLQRVLEGKPFMLKKKGELITPASGFTVFATANTKGKGSDDGRYMFTNVLNEAFLERFRITMEQEFPPVKIERKIIEKELTSVGKTDNDFAEKLVTWADVIRRTFADAGCDEVISTRRLVHIVETYGIFNNKMKAITLCLNRFDDDTKSSFADLYTKVDAGASADEILAPQTELQPEITEKQSEADN